MVSFSQLASLLLPLMVATVAATAKPTSSYQKAAEPTALIDLGSTLGKNYHPGNFGQDVETIRATLALYPFCIDGKNFEAFDYVFAPDAVLNYSAPLNVMRGLPTIKTIIQESLSNLTTLHHYGTQVIEVLSSDTAQAVTYVIANHFSIFNSSRVAYAYGQFQDHLVKKNGDWRISTRTLVFNGPIIGDAAILPTSLP